MGAKEADVGFRSQLKEKICALVIGRTGDPFEGFFSA